MTDTRTKRQINKGGFNHVDDLIYCLENWDKKSLTFQSAVKCVERLAKFAEKLEKNNANLEAYKLGRLVEARIVADGQFTDWAEIRKKRLEEQMGDIVEKYQELEDLIPSPICYR